MLLLPAVFQKCGNWKWEFHWRLHTHGLNRTHKPWVLKHNGVVYHYYCAVGKAGRVIGLATSRDLRDVAPKL
jgi:hypothetical protein